ncbi:hypothetical protein Tco_0123870 [Tanacetum coccineum]
MSSLTSFFLWLGFSTDLLVLLFLLACLCRGATSGLSREWTLLFLYPNRVKTSLSLGPSLVNTMALNGLLRRVGLSLSCFSLENALAVREERVPLDAVTGLCLLLLGFLFLSLILTLRVGCASFDGSFRHKLGVFVRPEVFLGELFLP